jgi:hypothetical protein
MAEQEKSITPYDPCISEIRTRRDVENYFDLDLRGIITTPGKFQGELVYVPYFWEKGLDGWADDELGDEGYLFFTTPEDAKEFPELRGKDRVIVREREDGFVYETTSL